MKKKARVELFPLKQVPSKDSSTRQNKTWDIIKQVLQHHMKEYSSQILSPSTDSWP